MPNTGPKLGSRRQMMAFLPIWFSASPSPTVVVVLPSPAGVGLNRRDQDQLAVGPVLQAVDVVERDLGLVVPVVLDARGGNAEPGGDLGDGLHGRALGDLDVGTHVYSQCGGGLMSRVLLAECGTKAARSMDCGAQYSTRLIYHAIAVFQ